MSIFEVPKGLCKEDFHKPAGTFCAQYMEGVSSIFAWGTTEEEAVDRLRQKVMEKLREQNITHVSQREMLLY